MTSPLFSIITVTKNASETLPYTLDSISSQTNNNYEVIICDALSNDNTSDIILSSDLYKWSKIKFIYEKDNGIYDAMNKGIKNANGTYLIFLNAGDSFHTKNELEKISDAINSNKFPDIIYGQTIIVNKKREFLGLRHLQAPDNLNFKSFSNGMSVCHQAFIVKREIAPAFDTNYKFSADYKWCIDSLKKSQHNFFIDEIIIDFLYGGVSQINKFQSLKERFDIMSSYYGFFPTIFRHISFIPRYVKRKKLENKFKY